MYHTLSKSSDYAGKYKDTNITLADYCRWVRNRVNLIYGLGKTNVILAHER